MTEGQMELPHEGEIQRPKGPRPVLWNDINFDSVVECGWAATLWRIYGPPGETWSVQPRAGNGQLLDFAINEWLAEIRGGDWPRFEPGLALTANQEHRCLVLGYWLEKRVRFYDGSNWMSAYMGISDGGVVTLANVSDAPMTIRWQSVAGDAWRSAYDEMTDLSPAWAAYRKAMREARGLDQ